MIVKCCSRVTKLSITRSKLAELVLSKPFKIRTEVSEVVMAKGPDGIKVPQYTNTFSRTQYVSATVMEHFHKLAIDEQANKTCDICKQNIQFDYDRDV